MDKTDEAASPLQRGDRVVIRKSKTKGSIAKCGDGIYLVELDSGVANWYNYAVLRKVT